MTIEMNPPDEWRAAAKGAFAALAKRAPGIAEALGAYDAFEKRRREKALAEFADRVNARLEKVESATVAAWFESADGQQFLGKAIDAALDAQTADKSELFANALLNGAAVDVPLATKMKFLDLVRSLSRLALDVLAELHREFGPKVGKPESTAIMPERLAERIASQSPEVDPYSVIAAIEELRAAGLFSHVTAWRKGADGSVSSSSSYGAGNFAFTTFTAQFVIFVTDPGR